MPVAAKIEILIGAQTEEAAAKVKDFASQGKSALESFAEGVRIGFGVDIVQKFLSLIQQIPAKIKEAVEEGLEFNRTMENARSGIAGLLLQFQPGKVHDFSQALKVADDVIEAIKEKAKGQPLQPLVEAFQNATGAASQAGLTLDKQVELVVDIARSVQAIGLPQQQIAQETRALLNGEINRTALLATQLGITNEQVQAAKEQGRLYEFIESKLQGIKQATLESTNNYTQLLGALKATVSATLGELTLPIFQTLKGGFVELRDTIISNKGELTDFFKTIASGVYVAMQILKVAIANAGALADLWLGNWVSAVTKFNTNFEVFGLKIGAWVAEARMEIYGGWEKIKIYFAGTFQWIEDSMAIMWQRMTISAQKGALDIATAWNKVSPVKIDTAGMAIGITANELALEAMEKQRDKNVEDARQAATAAMGAGAGSAAFDLATGAKKKGLLGGGGPVVGEISQEGQSLIDEINRAFAELSAGKEAKLQEEYEQTLAKLRKEVADYDTFQMAKYELDAVYGRKKSDLENAAEQQAYEQYLDRLEKEKQAHLQSLRTEMQQDADALRLKRDAIEVDEAKLEADFTKTDLAKKGERIRLLNLEIDAVQALIDKLTKLRDAQTDDAAKQAIDQQITGLSGEKRALDVRKIGLTNAPDPFSFGQQFQAKWVEIQNQIGTVAERSARAFASVWNSAIDKVTDGFTGMITGSMTVGQALTQIWQGIVTDIIREFVRMAVQWVFLEAFKVSIFAAGATAREGVRGAETASEAAHSGTRKGIHLGETIFHGIQMGIRFVAFLASEVAMTAVAIVQSAIRLPRIILETGKWLIMAAFKAAAAVADIPYVGPILAVAAIAAVIAAGAKAAGAFAEGGMVRGPGSGTSDSVPIYASNGEHVTRASSVNYWGAGFMDAINRGASGAKDVQRMVMAGMSRPVTTDRDALASMPGLTGGGAAAPVVNVDAKPQVKVVYAYDRQAIHDEMESSAGRAIIARTFNEERLRLGVRT